MGTLSLKFIIVFLYKTREKMSSESLNHVYLTPPISFSSFVDGSLQIVQPKQVEFDETRRDLVFRVGSKVTRVSAKSIPKQEPLEIKPDFTKATICTFSENEKIYHLKYSLCGKWLSYQRRPHQIEFQSTIPQSKPQTFAITCKKGTSTILGHYWVTDKTILLVTNKGAELHLFPSRAGTKPIKDVKFATIRFVYSPQYCVLLLLGNANAGKWPVQAVHVRESSLTKLPRFEVLAPSDGQLNSCQLHVFQLYGRLYCAHGDVSRSHITLLQLTREAVYRRVRIQVPLPGIGKNIHVCDNLLLIHGNKTKVCFIYDIKEESLSFPVAPPLPIDDNWCDEAYANSWTFLPIDMILDRTTGKLWRVGVKSAAIATALARQRTRQVDFLLRRAGSRAELLNVVRTSVLERAPLSSLASVFDMLNTILARAIQSGRHDALRTQTRSDTPSAAVNSAPTVEPTPRHTSNDDFTVAAAQAALRADAALEAAKSPPRRKRTVTSTNDEDDGADGEPLLLSDDVLETMTVAELAAR